MELVVNNAQPTAGVVLPFKRPDKPAPKTPGPAAPAQPVLKRAKRKTPKQTLARNIEFMGGCSDTLHAAIQYMTNAQIKELSNKLLPIIAGLSNIADDVAKLIPQEEPVAS